MDSKELFEETSEKDLRTKLVGNDIIGAINEIILGRVSIEDIDTIYALPEIIDIFSQSYISMDDPNRRHFVEYSYRKN